jgi:hypothetical protein
MEGGEEISGGFVVARGDGSELFEFAEEVLDQVARFVELAVKLVRCRSVVPGWDDGGFAGGGERPDNAMIGVKGLVGDHQIGLHLRQQRIGAVEVVGLPPGQQKPQRIAERVDQRVDFCAQPAAAAANRLIIVFFWGRRRCADGRAQWCCRSSHIRYRHRPRDVQTAAARPRYWPSG